MGRLCGGTNEISGIKAPLLLRGGGGGWRGGWWLVVWGVHGGVYVVGWVVVVELVGFGVCGVLMRDVVGGGGRMGGGMGDGG